VIGHEFVGRLASSYGDVRAGQPVFVTQWSTVDHAMRVCAGWCTFAGGLLRWDRLSGRGVPRGGRAGVRAVSAAGFVVAAPAALIEPISVGVRAISPIRAAVGDRAHVIGAGPIGCIIALLARLAGASVTLSEPSRRGVPWPRRWDLPLLIRRRLKADVVFDATGISAVAPTIADWVRPGGRVTLVGAYPPAPQLTPLLAFMFGELTLIGTRIYTRADILAAIDLNAAGAVDTDALVTEVIPLADGVSAIDRLRAARQ